MFALHRPDRFVPFLCWRAVLMSLTDDGKRNLTFRDGMLRHGYSIVSVTEAENRGLVSRSPRDIVDFRPGPKPDPSEATQIPYPSYLIPTYLLG